MKNKVYKIFVSFFVFICLLIGMFLFSSCDSGDKKDKISVVCSVFPQYDWIKNIVGESDEVEIELLMKNGLDMHSYELTFADMAKIASADIFIYIGGESDESWADKAISSSKNENLISINMVDILEDKALVEEIKEGMQQSNEDHEGHIENDEHVWLSLKNASIYVSYLAKKLGEVDIINKQKYIDNANSYLKKINSLDKEYQKATNEASVKTIVVADRFPFRYLVNDYRLDYYAAFAGCSTEVNASAETVTYLANKIDELALNYIFQIDGANSVANTVKQATINKNQKILTLNSMQTLSMQDIINGKSYLSIMKDNLNLIKEALSNV